MNVTQILKMKKYEIQKIFYTIPANGSVVPSSGGANFFNEILLVTLEVNENFLVSLVNRPLLVFLVLLASLDFRILLRYTS